MKKNKPFTTKVSIDVIGRMYKPTPDMPEDKEFEEEWKWELVDAEQISNEEVPGLKGEPFKIKLDRPWNNITIKTKQTMIDKLIKWLQKFSNQAIFAGAVFFTFTVAAIITGLVATFINSGLVSLVVFLGSFFGIRWTLNKYIINPAIAMKTETAKNMQKKEKGKISEAEDFTSSQEESITTKIDTETTVTNISGVADIPKPLHKMSEQQRKINRSKARKNKV